MRCVSCQKLSMRVICSECHERLLNPTVSLRKVGTLEVISLFKYRNIAPFLLTKHTPLGHRIYSYFSRRHLAHLLENFARELETPVHLIAIDDRPSGGYSHTAVLVHGVGNDLLPPLPGALRAQNRISYAGKSLRFRLENPRDFRYRGPSGIEAVLIDDIVTTGSTLSEAHRVLRDAGVEVLFAMTLADAGE